MGLDPWGFDEERQALARRLRRRRVRLGAVRSAVLLSYLLGLVAGASRAVQEGVARLGGPAWAQIAGFLVVLYGVGSALDLPFAYVSGHRWEASAGLSTRSARAWLADHGKAFVLGLGATVVAGEVILWLLARLPGVWWLAAWGLGVVFGVAIGAVAPVLLVPLFFRSRPVRDDALRGRIEALARAARTPIVGVFEIVSSRKSRRSNAGVMGHGRTRRIVVTDTLLSDYAPDEVDAVIAHELGHERFRDPLRGLAYSVASSLVVAAFAGLLYGATFPWFGLATIAEPAGLPVLALLGGVSSVAMGPLDRWSSRRRERRADRFALEITQDPAAFGRMIAKLHDRNLGVAHPPRWEVWLLHTHPSGRERVELARSHTLGARNVL